jgi:hypothetical protein
MQHPAGSAHAIRQEGLGDRAAWGKWCYEELEKEIEQGGEKTSWKGADTRCMRCGQSHQFWRSGSIMIQFPSADGDD